MIEWTSVAAAVATVVAVIIALWQAASAGRASLAEQRYRNWLEQRRAEEQHLTKALQLIPQPLRLAREFYFVAAHLLSDHFDEEEPTLEQTRQFDALAREFKREAAEYEQSVMTCRHVVAALREFHHSRGSSEEATEYDQLLSFITDALYSVSSMGIVLVSSPATIRSIADRTFDEVSYVVEARNATERAERTIARRLVRLYRSAPAG